MRALIAIALGIILGFAVAAAHFTSFPEDPWGSTPTQSS